MKKLMSRLLKLGLITIYLVHIRWVNFHAEYAHHFLHGSPTILTTTDKKFHEFRLELRVNATRYLRF